MRGRTAAAWVAGVVMVVGLTGCTAAPPASPGEPPAAPSTAAPSTRAPSTPAAAPEPAISPGSAGAVEVAGRPFTLRVPPGYDSAQPTALLVALHGFSSNATEVLGFFGLADATDSRGMLLALPEGSENPRGDQFWNASRACCNFYGSGVDDSEYLAQVIDAVSDSYAVDPGRVFVAGHSNGGFMALRLACDRADKVAAVASLAGAMDVDADCVPSRPVSVLQVHGSDDQTILFEGGAIDGDGYTSAAATTTTWRTADACPAADPSTGPSLDADRSVPGDDLTATAWTGCADGTEVALWTITDGGHVPFLTPDFTAGLLDWFEAHPRR